MAKTSIHFEACNVVKSERHNSREQELDYIFPELSKNNESLCYVSNLTEREKEIQDLYQQKIGQKMQSKTVPIREGVVVIDEKTTMSDLENLANEIKHLLGWTPLQIHIHRDEGYMKSADNKGGSEVAKLNLHAHLIFDCQDKNTGRMCRNTKQQMSQVQNLCADILRMERGQKSDRKHLNSIEYKIAVKEQNIRELEKQFEKLTAENEALRRKIDYFESVFTVSEEDISGFEVKGFLGSKIDKNKIKQLILSENAKKALNQKLQGENKELQKKIKELEGKISTSDLKLAQLETSNEQLVSKIENPTEKYLKQKLAEIPKKEKELFDLVAEKIKKEIQKNWKIYAKQSLELDNLYRSVFFSAFENKNIWQLMNTHYKGGQEQFEKDMQREVEKMEIIQTKQKQEEQEQKQTQKRGIRR